MEIKQNLLTINQFSRPGSSLIGVRGIVLHWIENPKTTALNNRNYFENLKAQPYETKDDKEKARFASAHFIIGLQGEIVQCLPENEMAYHVGASHYTPLALKNLGIYPNNCTLGIELCHEDWAGVFKPETLAAARELVVDLVRRHGLKIKDVYRHFDITGKECPLYFVRHEEEWAGFLQTIDFSLESRKNR
jgi:N-acetylmuramoyl-L-alanine amidase